MFSSGAFDLIIRGATVVTIDPERRVLPRASVAVSDGRIASIDDGSALEGARAEWELDGTGKLLIPGLVNAHTHAQALLMRGGPSDLSLSTADWLRRSLDPAMRAHSPTDSRLAAQIYSLESLRSGTTTTIENCDYSFMGHVADEALQVYDELGVRVIWGDVFCDQLAENWRTALAAVEERYPETATDNPAFPLEPLEVALARVESRMASHAAKPSARITVAPAPIMPTLNSTEGLRRALELARRYDTPLLMHAGADKYGSMPGVTDVEYLDGIGVLDPRLVLAHMSSTTATDMTLLRRRDTKVVWCAVITMLGEMCQTPVVELVNAGITVGIGTDDPNANQTASVLAEMRIAALTQLQRYGGGAISPEQILEIATIGGARAAGLDHEIGSIELGKKADLVLVDLRRPNMVPCHNAASSLVYQAYGGEVDTVIIDGIVRLRDGRLTALEPEAEAALYDEAQRASYNLLERANMQRLRDRGWQSVR